MDANDWFCDRCKQMFRPSDVPQLVPTDHGNQLVHPGECPPHCRQCGHERYAHSPFHSGKCIAAVCDCPTFVSTT